MTFLKLLTSANASFGARLAALICAVQTLMAPVSAGERQLRPWSVNDSIAIRYVSRSMDFPENLAVPRTQAIIYSPDSKWFFFETHWGDLSTDLHMYKLWIYSVERISSALQNPLSATMSPDWSVTMGTNIPPGVHASSPAAIKEARWVDDRTIAFVGSTGWAQDAIYKLDVITGRQERLSPGGQIIAGLRWQGLVFSYVNTLYDQQSFAPADPQYPVEPIRGNIVKSLVQPAMRGLGQEVYMGNIDRTARKIIAFGPDKNSRNLIPAPPLMPQLSPDGHWLLFWRSAVQVDASARISTIPAGWDRYSGLEEKVDLPSTTSFYDVYGLRDSVDYMRVCRPYLLNTETGAERLVLDAPLGTHVPKTMSGRPWRAHWTADSKSFVLVNVAMPIVDEQPERGHEYYIVRGQVNDERLELLDTMNPATGARVVQVEWQPSAETLLITREGADSSKVVLICRATAPHGPREPRAAGGTALSRSWPKVVLAESPTAPPMVLATDGKNSVDLMEADPALSGVELVRVEEFHWSEPAGATATGLLLRPKGADAPTPLVVQLEGFLAKPYDDFASQFLPDGVASSPFAAQALAANGIAVLRANVLLGEYPQYSMTKWINGERSDPAWPFEGKLVAERINAAVAELVRQGVADPDRVGLVGFSRSGYLAHYIATHPGTFVPRAAVVSDSISMGYAEYLADSVLTQGISSKPKVVDYTRNFGGDFWRAKQDWLRQAPGFNLDRTETPVLFSFHDDQIFLMTHLLESFGAYRSASREADVFYIPLGGHQLHRPLQRQALLSGVVDWMNFWLMDNESSSPAKKHQYRFWRALRHQRDERWAREGSPYDRGQADAVRF